MNRRLLLTSLSTLALVVPACGGDGFGSSVGDDPGTGTSTLSIEGDVEAQPRFDNAQDNADFDTSISIRITKNGVPVTTGEVTIASRDGDLALTYDPSQDGGRWRGQQSGYFEVYQLDVLSGDDAVEGVRVNGPDVHWFEAPLPGATVDAALPLQIEWNRSDETPIATLETRETDGIGIPDSGTYALGAGLLKHKAAETEVERLTLWRDARVAPAGAVGGSELRVRIRNGIDLVVAPCPTCVN